MWYRPKNERTEKKSKKLRVVRFLSRGPHYMCCSCQWHSHRHSHFSSSLSFTFLIRFWAGYLSIHTTLFPLSFYMLLPERCSKKRKNKVPDKVLWIQLLTSECLKWTVWFIRKPHSNVRDSGWETAQKWLNGVRKLFNIVKVQDIRVQDTQRIYKKS